MMKRFQRKCSNHHIWCLRASIPLDDHHMSCDGGDVITALSFDERKRICEVHRKSLTEHAVATTRRDVLARSACNDVTMLRSSGDPPQSAPRRGRSRAACGHHPDLSTRLDSFCLGVPFDLHGTEYAVTTPPMVLPVLERRSPASAFEDTTVDRLVPPHAHRAASCAIDDGVGVCSPGHVLIFVAAPCGVEEGQRCVFPPRSCGKPCGEPVTACGEPGISPPISG